MSCEGKHGHADLLRTKLVLLLDEVKKLDIETIELAKSKVKLVAKAAGLRDEYCDNSGSSSDARTAAWSNAESAVSKQIAAAQQAQRSAEQAVNRLQNMKQSGSQQSFSGGGGGYQKQNNFNYGEGYGKGRGNASNKGRGKTNFNSSQGKRNNFPQDGTAKRWKG